jgi:hypothetical protein
MWIIFFCVLACVSLAIIAIAYRFARYRLKKLRSRGLKFPIPQNLADLGAPFLTWALQSRGHLPAGTRVASYKFRPLDGGVHFEVGQFSLEYEQHRGGSRPFKSTTPAPASVVVKMINGNVSKRLQLLLVRFLLCARAIDRRDNVSCCTRTRPKWLIWCFLRVGYKRSCALDHTKLVVCVNV